MPLASPRTWVTAEVVTAAYLNAEVRDQVQSLINDKLFAYKTGDTARTSTTTTTADPHLTVTLAANARYLMTAFLIYDCNSTGDFNVDWTVPSGATGAWQGIGYGRDITADSTAGWTIRMNSNTVSQPRSYGGVTGNDYVAQCRGVVITSATSGTYALEWAQAVSDAGATTLRANSWLLMERVA